MVGHRDIRPERKFLTLAWVIAVRSRIHDDLLDPGAIRISVSVNETHNVRSIFRTLAAHHEPDGLTRLDAQSVGVSDHTSFPEHLRNSGRPPPGLLRRNNTHRKHNADQNTRTTLPV
jgi:hypothetical protein